MKKPAATLAAGFFFVVWTAKTSVLEFLQAHRFLQAFGENVIGRQGEEFDEFLRQHEIIQDGGRLADLVLQLDLTGDFALDRFAARFDLRREASRRQSGALNG